MGSIHGWGIAKRIEQVSNDLLELKYGTLYPALMKLEQQGWIRSEWGVSDNNRRARFYSITKAGRKPAGARNHQLGPDGGVHRTRGSRRGVRGMVELRSVLARVAALFRRRELDERIDDELAFHVEMETEEHIRRGMSPSEARRQARIECGGVAQVKEMHREVRGLPFLESLARDVLFALRSFAKGPGFTATVLATLALGTGVGTAVFSVVNAVLIHPLPYAKPDGLVMLWECQ